MGRGALNPAVVLLVVFALPAVMRARMPRSLVPMAVPIAFVATYLAGMRWIERRAPGELLYRAGFSEFGAGLAIGLALFTTTMLLLWMLGVYHPSGKGSAAPLAGGLLLAFPPAISEEIVFRGFLFRVSVKLLGTWGALVLTSALFGAAHAFNHGATVAVRSP
jgi:membrane protease YdiL (CAAX protease family)